MFAEPVATAQVQPQFVLPLQPTFPAGEHGRVSPLASGLVRLPRPATSLIMRLPTPVQPAVAARLATRRTEPDENGVTHRRYPSTDRPNTSQPRRDVSRQPTYRWDSRNHNFFAVGKRVEDRIDAGFKLANKGALYGARAEFRKALLAVAEALDAQYRVTSHTLALHEAMQAMKEAGDFTKDEVGSMGPVERIVASHQTPVLKQGHVDGMPALIATQWYYTFAQQRMVAGSGGAAEASHAMYALGKLHMALAELENENEQNAPQAMTFLQTALTVDASNFSAANELGVMLARFGQLPEARDVLQHSARIRPTPETWKNLEVVHHRLGEFEMEQRARTEWQRAGAPGRPVATGVAGNVQWVAPQAFAGRRTGGVQVPAATPPPTATQPKGFSLWPWH